MPAFIKKRIERLLRLFARLTLSKYNPIVVGVTGSVGKSSAKEAIALVLAKKFIVRKNEGNYNNEWGLPLTILGEQSAGKNVFGWLCIVFRAIARLLFRVRYPEVLVLEMAIDKPGDMSYLLEGVEPTIGVVTGVSESHLEFFGSLFNIAKEKGRLIASLPESGYAILNADDERVLKMGEKTRAKVVSFGLNPEADVRAEHAQLLQEGNHIEGMSFKLTEGGTTLPVRLPELIGKHLIPAVLAASAVGVALKMNLVETSEALLSFRPLPGRLTLIAGRNGMRIIDDSYNASLTSTVAALGVLREIIAPRRVVILGDMLEIGETKEEKHRALKDAVIGSGATIFVGVGKYMQTLADALRGTTFPEKHISTFLDPDLAIQALSDILRPGDLILIKGSEGMRMEKIVAAFMAEPERVKDFLCRQTTTWRKKTFQAPREWDQP